jgi:thiol-disulfide isomerase/thioredoxin
LVSIALGVAVVDIDEQAWTPALQLLCPWPLSLLFFLLGLSVLLNILYIAPPETGSPSVIDFTAKWCGPCKMISPVVDQLSKKYDDVCFQYIKLINLNFSKHVLGILLVARIASWPFTILTAMACGLQVNFFKVDIDNGAVHDSVSKHGISAVVCL